MSGVPDAVQRGAPLARKGAPLIRDRSTLGVRNGPGSAAHHFVLRCARAHEATSMQSASNGIRLHGRLNMNN
jgi:hypothetical protein